MAGKRGANTDGGFLEVRILTLVVPDPKIERIRLVLRSPDSCAKVCPECGTEIPTMDTLGRDAAEVIYDSVSSGFLDAMMQRLRELAAGDVDVG
jgi:hypothetical protein